MSNGKIHWTDRFMYRLDDGSYICFDETGSNSIGVADNKDAAIALLNRYAMSLECKTDALPRA